MASQIWPPVVIFFSSRDGGKFRKKLQLLAARDVHQNAFLGENKEFCYSCNQLKLKVLWKIKIPFLCFKSLRSLQFLPIKHHFYAGIYWRFLLSAIFLVLPVTWRIPRKIPHTIKA